MSAQNKHVEALAELSRAAELAEDIGRVRLLMDVHNALSRLQTFQGRRDDAVRHETRAHAIARAIENSLDASGLTAQLCIS